MVITYQGVQSFRVQFGDIVLAFDPVSKDSKHKTTSFGADIVLRSFNHPDMNGEANRGDKETFDIAGPGEYEIKGVVIKGLQSVSNYGGEDKINTIYIVNLENINLCFLGALSDPEVPKETKEAIDGVDILFAPVDTLGPSASYKFAVSLEPAIIIPMHYGESSLKSFLKEGGEGAVTADKLTIKKKDLEGKEGEIIVLEPQ